VAVAISNACNRKGLSDPMGIVEIVLVVVVVAGIVIAIFRWDRYRVTRKSDSSGTASQPTAEVFIDPETGRRMRVWYDSTTGQRDYRPE
jgi:hypothetical protein